MVAPAILIWGWAAKSFEIKKVGLALSIATAFMAGAAFLTGEPAEEVLEELPVFSERLVHDHEEAGEFALILSIVAGLSACAAIYFSRKKPQWLSYGLIFTITLLLLSSIAFLRTAHLGGLIRHEEIRVLP